MLFPLEKSINLVVEQRYQFPKVDDTPTEYSIPVDAVGNLKPPSTPNTRLGERNSVDPACTSPKPKIVLLDETTPHTPLVGNIV